MVGRRRADSARAGPYTARAMSEPPDTLPPKPEPPQGYDCCGGGCADCELRIYQRELQRWTKLERALREVGKRPTS
jgi:hypothetical protein